MIIATFLTCNKKLKIVPLLTHLKHALIVALILSKQYSLKQVCLYDHLF